MKGCLGRFALNSWIFVGNSVASEQGLPAPEFERETVFPRIPKRANVTFTVRRLFRATCPGGVLENASSYKRKPACQRTVTHVTRKIALQTEACVARQDHPKYTTISWLPGLSGRPISPTVVLPVPAKWNCSSDYASHGPPLASRRAPSALPAPQHCCPRGSEKGQWGLERQAHLPLHSAHSLHSHRCMKVWSQLSIDKHLYSWSVPRVHSIRGQ